MSASSLRTMTQTALIEAIQGHIVEKFGKNDITLEDLVADEELKRLWGVVFDPKVKKAKKAKKVSGSPKVSLEDRQVAPVDHSKCLCRVWKNGFDNLQCSSKASSGNFCKMHAKKIEEHGEWWLGSVTDPRPEEPYGPPTVAKPSRHYWSDQVDPKKEKKESEKKEKKEKKDPEKKEEKVEKKEKKEEKVEKKEEKVEKKEEKVEKKEEKVEKKEEKVEKKGKNKKVKKEEKVEKKEETPTPVVTPDEDEDDTLSTDENNYPSIDEIPDLTESEEEEEEETEDETEDETDEE